MLNGRLHVFLRKSECFCNEMPLMEMLLIQNVRFARSLANGLITIDTSVLLVALL